MNCEHMIPRSECRVVGCGPDVCGFQARCHRPRGHRGHHGGYRGDAAPTAPNPEERASGAELGHPLTPREREVVVAIVLHGRRKEAAQSLGIAENTVRNHSRSILAKTGASTMHQVPYLLGWVTLP